MKVGIAGLGAIGLVVAEAIDDGIENLELVGVTVRDADKALRKMSKFKNKAPVLNPEELAKVSDIVVECVPKAVFRDIAEPTLKAGRLLVTVSGAGLLANPDIIELANINKTQIVLATGALLGLDAVRAAAEGRVKQIRMVTRKPPNALKGAPHLIENDISVENLDKPTKVFDGNAREGAKGFPANVNVAAALGLAGVGPDETKLEIWADPELTRNTHSIRVDSDSALIEMSIENVQSQENPGTGKITALSVIACLRGMVSPLRDGT